MKKGVKLNTAFDEYTITGQIGAGGNGVVYSATDNDGMAVAIKTVSKNISREKLKRFKNEINFCQKYHNENIIEIIDNGFYSDIDGEYIFYVMPLCECSLRSQMKRGLSPEQAVKAFSDICRGLKFAHSKGCIHRDIKPENILFNGNGNYIIADFGIAHFQSVDKLTTVETKETSRLANFSYHAPEQMEANGQITFATDIFALGLMLNEMFTGKIPVGNNYKNISDVNADYAFLDKIVQKMLLQNPQARYKNIDELSVDFEARKQNYANLKKIAVLSQPLVEGEARDYLTDNPITVEKIELQNGELIATLSNSPNDAWVHYFYSSLSHYTSSPVCYKNFRFYGNQAKYEINAWFYAGNSNDLIKSLISDFKSAISSTNSIYAQMLVDRYQKMKQQKIAQRRAEIDRLEQENKVNAFLKDLL